MRHHPNSIAARRLTLACLLAMGAAAGCGEECECLFAPGDPAGVTDGAVADATDTPAKPVSDAVTEFVKAFYAGDYDSVRDHIAALDAQVKADPDDGYAVLYSALARMWRLGEEKRDPTFDLAARAPVALEALDLFKQAHQMLPDDGRIPAWIGFMTMRIGEALQNDKQIDEGKKLLDASITEFPTFTRFVRGIALLGHAHDDPDFADAPEDMWAVLEACGYDVDREHPTFDYPTEPKVGDARICMDIPQAKHNWKGFFLHAGDIFSKAGDPITATAMWAHAKKSPTFNSWPERDVLLERIDSSADRAAKLTDDDPDNDPDLFAQSAHTCVGCHAD